MTELALMLEVAQAPVDVLDQAVRRNNLVESDRRHAQRLRGLRARRGPVPEWYPEGSDSSPGQRPGRREDLDAARAILTFAAHLHHGKELDRGVPLTGWGGRYAAAIASRSAWRPLPSPASPHSFVEMDLPVQLMWRGWMVLPERGIVRVVNDTRLHPDDMDIWWGVHDGVHMDHLACFDITKTTPIEFGSGLLAAESLAMASEVLAGAEALIAGDLVTQRCVRVELTERVGRLPLDITEPGPYADLAQSMDVRRESEFPALTTVARAYVAGPLRLIATHFVDRLIPAKVSRRFDHRWLSAERNHPAVYSLGNDARRWWAQHG